MKTLAVMRHAKAGRIAPGLGDAERSLTPCGVESAPSMGRAMCALGVKPNLVMCSQARRARETWELVAPELDAAPQVQILSGLYLATPAVLLSAVQGVEAVASSVLLVGHNPGLGSLAAALSGPDSDPGAVRSLAGNLPPAGLAILSFDVASWRDIGQGKGRLIHFLRPGDLG